MSEAWEEALTGFLRPRSVLVGVGSRLRGDDAFGPLLVDRLHDQVCWPLCDAAETPENYIGRIASHEPERVLILDAVRSGVAPGRIGFFPAGAICVGGVSTHMISLRLFAELLAARTACAVALLGAEPGRTAVGAPLSPEMEASLSTVARHLVMVAKGIHDRNA